MSQEAGNVAETVEQVATAVADGVPAKSFIHRFIMSFTEESFIEKILRISLTVVLRFLIAWFIFKLGQKFIKFVLKTFDRLDKRAALEKDIHIFLRSVLNISLYLILFIFILLILGAQQSSLAAIFGAAGVGIGFALKDTLANFAGGLILLFFKPYKTGDFIEITGKSGEVQGITVFSTELNTIDNKRIIVPNGILVANDITNYTKNKVRRVEILFGIGYKDDFRKAIKCLEDVADSQDKVLQTIERTIRVKELGDSSVNILYRVWCKVDDYWDVYYTSIELAKETFDREGISIPFPQRDVHIIKDDEEESGSPQD